MIITPLPVGHINGILNFLPSNVAYSVFAVLVIVKMIATIHLFHFRYIGTTGTNKLFPLYHVALFALLYSVGFICPTYVMFTPSDRNALVDYHQVREGGGTGAVLSI